MALDAERIGERERELAPAPCGDRAGFQEGLLGRGRIPEVALQVHDLAARDQRFVDVVGRELAARAEVSVHRALRVARHEDQAARGRRAADRGPRVEAHADGTDVVREDLARAGPRAPCRCTRHDRRAKRCRPSCWPPSRPRPRSPGPSRNKAGAARCSSISAIVPLSSPCSARKRFVGVREHIDDRVANSRYVDQPAAHDYL